MSHVQLRQQSDLRFQLAHAKNCINFVQLARGLTIDLVTSRAARSTL